MTDVPTIHLRGAKDMGSGLRMLGFALRLAEDFADRNPRDPVIWTLGDGRAFAAWWTKSRAITVERLADGGTA